MTKSSHALNLGATTYFRPNQYTVLDFGADASGVKDSSAAFVACYTTASLNKGIMKIPSGTYKTSSVIKLKSNTSIIGDGMRSTIINYSGTGFWLDNTDVGTIMTKVTIQGLNFNAVNQGGGSFMRLGNPGQSFAESNQHIDTWVKDVWAVGVSTIIPGTYGIQANTWIRGHIEDCIFVGFDTQWDLQKFDEGWVVHNMLEDQRTYGIYLHNDTGDLVSDETTFLDNHIVVTTNAAAGIYVKESENLRFFNTYMDASGGTVGIGFKLDSVHNATIDGLTLNSETTNFYLINPRNITISHAQYQNPDQSPVGISSVTFTYGSSGTDLTGVGGPFREPN